MHSDILKALQELGYNEATPIQAQAIPQIVKGLDIRAAAQTGTGKTAAFMLPSLNRLVEPSPSKGRGPRILVLVPTRELAMQVATETVKYTKYLPFVKTVCIYGGSPYPEQNKNLSRPFDILVATPGRLIDHMEQGRVDFSRLEVLILDEADRMLDMGFIHAVEQIAKATPKARQTLMFSATLKGSVLGLSQRLLNKPVEISVAIDLSAQKKIDQRLFTVTNIDHKYRLLQSLLVDPSVQQVVVFTATKRQADKLERHLTDGGFQAAALHGDMKQRQRTRTMALLREGKIKILVATDVAARGIDVPAISHVINFDLPDNVQDYVHRIGRTGRAGATGIAYTFAHTKEMSLVKQIERFTGQRINVQTASGPLPPLTVSTNSAPSEERGFRSSGRGSRSSSRGFKPRERDARSSGRGFRPSDRESRYADRDSSPPDRNTRSSDRGFQPRDRGFKSRDRGFEPRSSERSFKSPDKDFTPVQRDFQSQEGVVKYAMEQRDRFKKNKTTLS
ncbi:MAG: DEAD/DEAH box helicase [Rhabdochlamydiaceae bacterium]